MAITQEVILKVGTNEAVKTVKDLRDNINAYKNDLVALDKNSSEYAATVAKVAQSEAALKQINADVTVAIKSETTAYKAAAGSMDEISLNLGKLRKEYRALSEEQRNSADVGVPMLASINALDSKIKELDASMGNFQRNVGNYPQVFSAINESASKLSGGFNMLIGTTSLLGIQNSGLLDSFDKLKLGIGIFQGAFQAIPQLIAGATSIIPKFRAAMAALNAVMAANPIGAVIAAVTALAASVTVLIALIKSNNDEQKKLNKTISDYNTQLHVTEIQTDNYIRQLEREGVELIKIISAKQKMNNTAIIENQLQQERILKGRDLLELNVEEIKAYKSLIEESKILDQIARELQNDWLDEQTKKTKEQTQAIIKNNEARKEANNIEIVHSTISFDDIIKDINTGVDRISDATDTDLAISAFETYVNGMVSGIETIKASEKDLTETDRQLADERIKKAKEEYNLKIAQEKAKQSIISNTTSILQSASQLLGEETEAGKAVAIAAATIATYQAATEAYKSMAGIPVIGPAAGAVAAAAAIAAGIANVKKISETKVPGSGGASSGGASSGGSISASSLPPVPTMPELRQPIQETITHMSSYDEDVINRTQPVLVVEDLKQVQNRVRVTENENMF